MTGVSPGWYKDPADPTTQRYWDGEGWIGHALPAEAEPPPGPPPAENGPTSPAPAAAAPPGSDQAGPAATAPAEPAPQVSPGLPMPPGPPHLPEPGAGVPPGPGAPPGWQYREHAAGMMLPVPRPHGLTLATPGARLLARLVDIGVLALLNLIVNGWFIWQYAVEMAPTFAAWQGYWEAVLAREAAEMPQQGSPRASSLQIVIVLIAAALWLAYEIPAVANNGQTLGKRLLRIRVVRVEAPGPIGFARSLRRWNTLGLPTLLWPCCGIGFVLQFVDVVYLLADRPLRQALHDKSARTVVVRVADDGPGGAGPTPVSPAGPTDRADDDEPRPGGPA